MFKLIKNEFYKLFHKKSTYIVLGIILLFLGLVNFIYNHEFNNNMYSSNYIYGEGYEEEIKKYENDPAHVQDLVYAKANLEVANLVKEYKQNAWEARVLTTDYLPKVTEYYSYLLVEKNETLANNLKLELDNLKDLITKGDWKYFVKSDLVIETSRLRDYKSNLNIGNLSSRDEENIKKQIEVSEEKIKLLNYRLDNNVAYGDGYLDRAIVAMEQAIVPVVDYKYETNDDLKKESEMSVKEFYENKYILDNKVDTNNMQTLRGTIKNLFYELEFLILVFVIMISGAMVSDEFSKGTIKNLLTIPYKRSQILAAKFITCLLMIPFIVLFILLGELIIGGLFFGYSSLSIPVVNYALSSGTIETMNIFIYYGLMFVSKLPYLILLTTLAFSISTILSNTAFAVAITFCGYIGSVFINTLAAGYKIKALNYFVTTNWDFSCYLFGGSSAFGIPLTQAIIVCLVYLLIMLVVTFIVFKKKNIKNI
ncbi:MAG: ABC transporter permease [Bacilli bacterium]